MFKHENLTLQQMDSYLDLVAFLAITSHLRRFDTMMDLTWFSSPKEQEAKL
jgi:hypothetical protein